MIIELQKLINETEVDIGLDEFIEKAYSSQQALNIWSDETLKSSPANFLFAGENGSGKTNFCILTAPLGRTAYIQLEAGSGNSTAKYLADCGLLYYQVINNSDNNLTISKEIYNKYKKTTEISIQTNEEYFIKRSDLFASKGIKVVIFDSISAFYNLVEQKLPDTDIFGTRYNLEIGGYLARFRNFLNEILYIFNSKGISVIFTCPLNNKGELIINGAKNKEFINGLTDTCYRIKETGTKIANLDEPNKSFVKAKKIDDAMEPVLFSVKDRGILRDMNPVKFLQSRIIEFDKEEDGEMAFSSQHDFFEKTGNLKCGIYGLLLNKFLKERKRKQNAEKLRNKFLEEKKSKEKPVENTIPNKQ